MKQRCIIIIMFICLMPGVAKAQWTFDVLSVEAYINDHKKQRSLLLARSTLEHSNKLLHEYTSDEVGGYKNLNVDLDKYTRAFDVIDVMYQSLRTALNARSTYSEVSQRIVDYKNLLTDFNEKVVEHLFRSLSDLVLYATGAAACSTADLMLVLDAINNSMDNIEKLLNRGYYETWRYIQLRIGYWKEKVYRKKSKQQIINDAFGRWKDAGYNYNNY